MSYGRAQPNDGRSERNESAIPLIAEMQRIQEKAHRVSESIHDRVESLLHPHKSDDEEEHAGN